MADTSWTLFRAAAYLAGKGVTFGQPIVPTTAVNDKVYSIVIGMGKVSGIAGIDTDLSVIADASLDHFLVTPMVGLLHDPVIILKQAVRKLKKDGHLIILVKTSPEIPGQYVFTPDIVKALVRPLQHWRIKGEWEEDGQYLLILKKIDGRSGLDPIKPRAAKRACVARYGALGDAVIMTPLLRKLKEEGYEVTVNISSYCLPVFKGNPNIDNILIQERDLVPNTLLGGYWKLWEAEYDKYINLSESIEGDLLMVEGRPSFFTTKSYRHSVANKNYYDYTLLRAGYPEVKGMRGELFFTNAEERNAREFFSPLNNKFVVLWALNGSSHHKVYPLIEPTLKEWFKVHPGTRVITVGDYAAKLLEFDHPCMIHRAGEWSIRESLIATKYVDLVIGPETMMTNAAGCFATPKITLLSHSTHENLCKYWENDYCLAPDTDIAPCYPCHQLHYTKESCPIGEARDVASGAILGQAPKCALAIQPQRLLERMEEVYQKHYAVEPA